MIICNDGAGLVWGVEISWVARSYQTMFEIHNTFEEWNDSTRCCDYCGANFDEGYMCGDGEHYACDQCFEQMSKGHGWVDCSSLPEGAKVDDPDGFWFEPHVTMEPFGKAAFPTAYEDTGWFWTQFWE